MWAIEIANRLGWLDVDAMLDSMTPQQFNERVAFEIVKHGRDDKPADNPADPGGFIASEQSVARVFGL